MKTKHGYIYGAVQILAVILTEICIFGSYFEAGMLTGTSLQIIYLGVLLSLWGR